MSDEAEDPFVDEILKSLGENTGDSAQFVGFVGDYLLRFECGCTELGGPGPYSDSVRCRVHGGRLVPVSGRKPG